MARSLEYLSKPQSFQREMPSTAVAARTVCGEGLAKLSAALAAAVHFASYLCGAAIEGQLSSRMWAYTSCLPGKLGFSVSGVIVSVFLWRSIRTKKQI